MAVLWSMTVIDTWDDVKNEYNAYLEGAVISLTPINKFASSTYENYTKAQWAKIATQYGVDFQNWEVFGTTSLYVNALISEYSGDKYYQEHRAAGSNFCNL